MPTSHSTVISRRVFSVPGRANVGVEFTTMSKGYNMAGWRVGFCAGNAEMVRALATIKTYYDYGMFNAVQIAAIMALRHTDAAVEAQSQLYQRRRNVMCEGLKRIGWDVTPPRAGMFVWAKIPDVWMQPWTPCRLPPSCWKKPTWRSALAAVSGRPAKAICGWPWSKTKTACGKQCGRSANA